MAKGAAAKLLDEYRATIIEKLKPFEDMDAGHLQSKVRGFVQEALSSGQVEGALVEEILESRAVKKTAAV